jgi:signal transduction histidine kinase
VSAFANLPISRKLMAAFAAVVAVILVSSAIVYDRLRVIETATSWRVHTAQVLETLQMAMDAMLDQETGVRGYMVSGNEISLEPYQSGGNAFTAAMRTLKDLTADNPAQQGRLDELNELAMQWRSGVAEREIALMAKPETREHARALGISMAGKTAMDRVRAKVDEIARVQRDLLAKRAAVQEQAYATAYTMIILGGGASLIVALLMGVLLTRLIAVPITRMTNVMAALAKGDTSIEVPRDVRSDEIGAMAKAVQVFKESIVERHRAQAELAHVNRVATMGQLAASIAHEVNQPIGATVTNAQAALRWLGARTPDLDEVREALDQIVRDGKRAGDVVSRIHALVKKAPERRELFDLNDAILEVVAVTRSEVLRHGVSLQTHFATGLPRVQGDRTQVQQVILNLILNAVEAMNGSRAGERELLIRTRRDGSDAVLVAIRDSGPGLDPTNMDRVFEPFYTTKAAGMGMGLAICRSIIDAHGGRLWAAANKPRGAVFRFTLPGERDETTPAEPAAQAPVG